MASKNDIEFKSLGEELEDYLIDIINELTDNLDKARGGRGANSTGSLRQSIGNNLQDGLKPTAFGYSMQIELNDYYEWVDEGRPAGKAPPTSEILNWVRNKPNLLPQEPKLPDEQIAYLIARKIGKYGTKGTNFYSDVMTKDKEEELFDILSRAGAKDITDNLDNIF
jgi:hypothetical protein